MNAEWMKKRQTKFATYAAVYILVVLAVLGGINFLANRYEKSYDSTGNKQYSLSDQTIKVVKNLKNDVTVTYFDQSSRFPEARGTLDRYSALSPKFHVDYIDPERKPQQAKAAGYRRDVTILVDSGQRKEEAKSLSEEEITGALIRSLKGGDRNACFVTGSGEHSLDQSGGGGFSAAKQLLERNNYKTRSISLLKSAAEPATPGSTPTPAKIEVPKDCTVLIVAGPQHDYPQAVTDAIKSYVEGGGKALIMLDPPLEAGRNPIEDNTTLDALLESWGVTVQKNLVLDLSGVGSILGLGADVPIVRSYESHAIVNQMKDLATAFPLARSLEVKSGGSAQKLFGTDENSAATFKLDTWPPPRDPKTYKNGPFTLAAAGTVGSSGRFVVVGSSSWIGNGIIRFNGNSDLFMNMINWLTADEDLISIRPKTPEDRPLTVNPSRISLIFYLSVLIFPLAVVGFGMATWWKRR